jgi:acyl carrier protein
MKSKTQEEVQEWIVQWLVDIAAVARDSIELDKPFNDYHLDSLTAAEFSDDIHEWSGIEVPITALWNYPTLADMTRYLSAKSNGKAEEEMRPVPSVEAVQAILNDVENLSDDEVKKILKE